MESSRRAKKLFQPHFYLFSQLVFIFIFINELSNHKYLKIKPFLDNNNVDRSALPKLYSVGPTKIVCNFVCFELGTNFKGT